jgi:hypothetical protein
MGLFDLIATQRKADKKVDDIVVTEMSYPCGLLPLDYANGLTVISYDKNDRPIAKNNLIGLVGGSKVTIIGITGTGKSALGIEYASAPLHRFGNMSLAQHADIEQATTMQRIIKVTKLPPSLLKESYKIFRDKGAEDIIDQFKSHCMAKLNNRKMFTYKTGVLDLYGDEIEELIPSNLLIDSFAMFKSKEIDLMTKDVKDLTNNMQAARSAQFNKQVLTQMLAYGKQANVGIISINHINTAINTGFVPKAAQQMYLSQDEAISGSGAALYLANNLNKLKLLKKYNPEKEESMDYGIPGFLAESRYLKSRTNAANRPVELVFDHRSGRFSKILTLFHFAVKNELLLGNNRNHFLPGLEGVKFTKRTFKNIVEKSPEVMQALYEVCLPSLEAMLSTDSGVASRVETNSDKIDAVVLALEDHQRDMEDYKRQGWVEF